MVRKRKEVKEFHYPIEPNKPSQIEMWKPIPVLLLFHISMFLQLISGVFLDFAAPFISTFILRQFHGFAGAFFTIMFVIYLGIIAINSDFRALREPINYVEIVFYALLILFGLAVKYPTVLPFLGQISPFHCTLLTYGWVAVSVLGGGGIIQGVASIYFLYERARSSPKFRSGVSKEVKKNSN